MAESMNLVVTAEGVVETEGQLDFLRAQPCDEAQGFLLCRPSSLQEAARFLRDAGSTRSVPLAGTGSG